MTRQVGKLAAKIQQALNFHRQGLLSEAENRYASILAKHPAQFDALHLLGVLRMQQGRPAEALGLLTAALKQKPSSPETLSNTAAALMALERYQEALAKIDESLEIKPGDADAHFNRGVTLTHLGRQDEAFGSYQRALAIAPDHVAATFNLGNLLSTATRYDDAMACYDKVLTAVPRHLEALNNRGNVLSKLGRHQEAVESYNRVLAVNPNYLNALVNRGSALKELARYDEALADYERVLAIHPHHVDTLYNRGNGLIDLGRPEAAIESLRRALAITPDDWTVHTSLVFALNFDATATEAERQAERARWYEQHARPYGGVARTHVNDPAPQRRLRVGYVSPYFRHQAATYAFAGVLLAHDRERFEVICYSDTVEEDDVTARLQACAARWHRTSTLSDDQLTELIRSDGIDILVDLAGHMRGHRLLVFARKPAPIQVTAWGEPTGTGLKVMDYLLADPVLVPSAQRGLLAERVVDLPGFLGYWTPETLPAPGPLPAIERGHITFGSFNRAEKILDPVLRCWSRILRAVPQARLVLKDRLFANPSHRTRIAGILALEGIAADRVTLLGSSDRSAHFAAYQTLDIALDPFPHGGGMTTLDALWMGLPVVTWAGATISSRLAAASLTAIGLTELIASDPDEYVRIAIDRAADLDGLARLRSGLRSRVADSAIGDSMRYTHAVEAAYCEMWQRWCTAVADRGASQPAPARSMESYSQHGQDQFVYDNFFKQDPRRGTFVDIGAYDGITFSNSLFFERNLGWSGVCIEPLPDAFEQCRANRTAICVNCAVSDHDGIGDFIDVDVPDFGKMYSGIAIDQDLRHVTLRRVPTSSRVLQVKIRRLSDILDENGIRAIDYMSIDTEGSELKILRSFDFSSYPVRVISIENNHQNPEIRNHLLGLGYRLVKVFAGFDELYAK